MRLGKQGGAKMRDDKSLVQIYTQNLEEDVINELAILKNIELRKAFDIYYSSKLAAQIENGSYGIENLDAKYFAENEHELFV